MFLNCRILCRVVTKYNVIREKEFSRFGIKLSFFLRISRKFFNSTLILSSPNYAHAKFCLENSSKFCKNFENKTIISSNFAFREISGKNVVTTLLLTINLQKLHTRIYIASIGKERPGLADQILSELPHSIMKTQSPRNPFRSSCLLHSIPTLYTLCSIHSI